MYKKIHISVLITIMSTHVALLPLSLYDYSLNLYKNTNQETLFQKESLKTFRSIFEHKNFLVIFSRIAHHFADFEKEKKHYLLGQSLSYMGLTAQLLSSNPNNFEYIAFSGMEGIKPYEFFNNDTDITSMARLVDFTQVFKTHEQFKNGIHAYYRYLKKINFFTSDPKKEVIIADQVESGSCLVAFEFVLDHIKELDFLKKDEHIPLLRWYVHTTDYYHNLTQENIDLKYGMVIPDHHDRTKQNIMWRQVPPFVFSRNVDDIKGYPHGIHATGNDDVRLVAKFKQQDWGTIDPLSFVPAQKAQSIVLHIIHKLDL